MSTVRDNSGTISSGINPDDSGTVHANGGDISAGFGHTPSGTARAEGADITSGMHGSAPMSAGMSCEKGDTLTINSITYQYQGVISKSTGEAEIFLLSRDGKECVFKLYYPNFKPKQDILKQIKDLHHEDIINVHDYGYFHDRFFEIMDYAEGGTLDQYLPIKDIAIIKQILAETVNAYKYCHARGIIHKDIKPQNLYYKNADGTDLLIGDFGISTLLETSMSRRLTSQSLTVGYGAPEMYGIGGKVYIGKEVDYYALGITLIHIWEGKSPFEGLHVHAISNLTTSGNIHIPEDMPKEIKQAIKGLITVDYTKRWGFDEIQRWLTGEDVPVHFQIKEVNYPPYQFGLNDTATTAEELAKILKNNLEKGRKHLYSGKLSAWVNLFNQGLAVEMDRIIEDDYPKDQDAGIQKAIYLLNPDEPFAKKIIEGEMGSFLQSDIECRTTDELADVLEAGFKQFINELSSWGHPLYLYLESHDAEEEASTFRKFFKTFSAQKAVNTIILELRGRDSFKLGNHLFSNPEELLQYPDQQFLVNALKDKESYLSLWIEGSKFQDIQKQVVKWRCGHFPKHDIISLPYALAQGSPFTFPDGEQAYNANDFAKLFLNYVEMRKSFSEEADYWLKKYCATDYDQIATQVLERNYGDIKLHDLIHDFIGYGQEKYYFNKIAPIVEKAYSEKKLPKELYVKHKLFLIKNIEIKVFGKDLTGFNNHWSKSFKKGESEKQRKYLMSLVQQLIVYNTKYVTKDELGKMLKFRPPEREDIVALLNFIDQLAQFTTGTTIKNISNIHYANALNIFSEPVLTNIPDQSAQPWYDELDTPHQNIKRLIPQGLFCIPNDDYKKIEKIEILGTESNTEKSLGRVNSKKSGKGTNKVIFGVIMVLLLIPAGYSFLKNGYLGKIQEKYLKLEKASNAPSETASAQQKGHTTTQVNLRSEPGTEYSSLGVLSGNTPALLIGSLKDKNGVFWNQLKITEGEHKGTTGFIHNKYFGDVTK